MWLFCLFFIGTYGYLFPKISNSRILLLPGYGCDKTDYNEMIRTCEKWNIQLDVVPIHRFEWLRISRCMFDELYWNYSVDPSNMFGWYIQSAKNALFESVSKNNNKPIILCGHSAGGWLARLLMNNGTLYNDYELKTNSYVSTLVTMGTPHICHKNKELDPTHGSLTYVNREFPDAFLRKDGIQYLTLGSRSKRIQLDKTNWKTKMIKNSYLTVLGESKENIIEGDSIVPIQSSHLKYAKQMTFNDVYHFPRNGKKYYWKEEVMKEWLNTLEIML